MIWTATCFSRTSTTARFHTLSKNFQVSVINISLLSRNSLLTKAVAENDTHVHGDYSSVPPFTTDIDELQAISDEYEEQYDRRMGKGSWERRRHVKSHYVRPHPFTKTASVKKELRRATVNPRDAFKEADADAERNSGHIVWDFSSCGIAVSLQRFCWKTSPGAEGNAKRDCQARGYCTHDGRGDVPPQPCQRML
jgi:hypothetical protein